MTLLHPARPVDASPSLHDAVSPETLTAIVAGLARVPELWRPAVDALPDQRGAIKLIANDDYEAWLIGWPPGSNVEPHDHGGSHGAFAVLEGELAELRWNPDGTTTWRTVCDTATVPAGVVHDVVSVGDVRALSIHAYSPALTSMSFFDDDGITVIATEPVVAESAFVEPTPALLHPARG